MINTILPEWVKHAMAYPLGFAQVREDPLLDVWAINQLTNNAVSAIMVASGGCTASLLATQKNIRNITLVDANKSQLALCQLKLMLLSLSAPAERLALLGHSTMPIDLRYQHIEQLLINAGYDKNQLGDLDKVASKGLDFSGRYELLFAELQKELTLWQIDKTNDALLKEAFKKVMALENLVALFGESATQNAALPFWEHFFNQTKAALASEEATDNPFLNQLLLGKFKDTAYPWLTLQKQMLHKNFSFINHTIGDALNSNDKTYDFIHLSNVLDWLNVSDAKKLLDLAAEKLNKGGLVIIRQLNSTLDIPTIGANIKWLKKQSDELLRIDRSFFYKQIHLGQKL